MAELLADILRAIRETSDSLSVSGLHGGARAFMLSRLVRQNPSETVLILTGSPERAQELCDDCLLFFHPDDAGRIRIFPENSSLPFSRLSPDGKAQADRIQLLHRLLLKEKPVIIAPMAAAMRRTPPKSFVLGGARTIRARDPLDPIELASYLTAYGYEDVGLVEDEGSFARRGGIFDIWSPTVEAPVRIELDGDRIVSMRQFDPVSQRSKKDVIELWLIPVSDIPFDEASRRAAAHRIRGKADVANLPAREKRSMLEAIHEGIAFAGIETLLSLFHESTSTLFDYLPRGALTIIDEATDARASSEAFDREITELWQSTSSPERIVSPSEIALSPDELEGELSGFRLVRLDALEVEKPEAAAKSLSVRVEGNADVRPIVAGQSARPPALGEAAKNDMLTPLASRINEWREAGMRIVFTCHTELQATRLSDLFRWHGIALTPLEGPFDSLFDMSSSSLRIKLGRLSAGFRWPDEGLAVITDEEIFGAKVTRRKTTSRAMEPFTSFSEIAEGDAVVHEQHGIGRYLGLVHLSVEGKPADYLLLEYLGGDKLYLPVYRLNLVGRYIGSGDAAPALDRLGGPRWSQVQKKVDAAIRLMAKELLDIYAQREIFPGHPFPDGGAAYEEFSASFPYDETPDQERAIEDVNRDMSIERPMDRLVCGDVGYGKTEVAIRAAFRAAMSGKQVAVLVPTTVLAFQHYETFVRRFRETPIRVEMLSRFRSPRERKSVALDLASGSVDVVIGTHALLQKSMSFRDLGLLIIDEEHRFGVRHKERIKQMKASVDVMTLTATPIPRTLNLSLSGIRDISIINTPPADRLSIATYVSPFDEGVVRQAILREIARGGQVFFVHNRVETIHSMFDRLSRLVPEARIVVGHGQMPEHELEKVMIDFLERRADVLLCTTIIESGLDIPNANTIIIHRADMMGLAQLYQLRGRVGRSNLKAFAYLLTPEEGEISPLAKKRLTVLKRFTELGSGFQIAMHDLEFRGAGNILGAAQSGHIAAVGYELYARLLERAVRKLSGKKVEEEMDPELSLKVAAYLPETYVPDPGVRIDLYRRLANRISAEEIGEIGSELTDRFGPLPTEAVNLLGVMEIKVLARILRMRQITFDGATFSCQLDSSTPLEPRQIMDLAQKEPGLLRMSPPDRLLIAAKEREDDASVLRSARNTLSMLLAYVSENRLKSEC